MGSLYFSRIALNLNVLLFDLVKGKHWAVCLGRLINVVKMLSS